MSQAIRALEVCVGAAPFMWTTRSVGLTEAGERFLARARPAFEELVAAGAAARDLGQSPAGLLRLSAPPAAIGSPAYLHGRERPARIDDLRGHACLRLRSSTGAAAPWRFADGRLHALLTRFAVTVPGLFLYHPRRRQVLPRLRAFIEHVRYRSAGAP